MDGEMGRPQLPVDGDGEVATGDGIGGDGQAEGGESHTGAGAPIGGGGPGFGPGPDLVVPPGTGHHGVDQAPVHRLLTPDAFGPGGELVGPVPPDLALVDHPGEAAGAGQHPQQGHLGQRHGG